ncbi:hypothetical protein D9V84_02545 [Bacteroidetes/Chlorobi group bacterium Naka2016]|jgi:hypothetical protein|nr:MAG: hypothetical protein D9V84_02545 [Bacteroidetes/Chlorobi group bacterium Naka2016]
MATEIRLIDPILTSIAQEYRNSSFVGNHLFPVVTVNKRKGKIPVFGKQAFVERDTVRAIRSKSNRISSNDIEYLDFEMIERDVEVALDYIEEEEMADFLEVERQATNELVDILLLGREKQIADYVQNPNNYPPSMKMEITATNAFDDYSKNVDPILKIREGLVAVRQKISRYPNVMVIGESTYRALMFHPKVIDKFKAVGIAKTNTQILSELLEIPNIYVGLGVYTTNGSDFVDIWGDNIVLAYVEEEDKGKTSRIGLSFGYLLQKKGFPEVDTYFENGGKIKVIRATDAYAILTTTPEAGFLIYNTNHLS